MTALFFVFRIARCAVRNCVTAFVLMLTLPAIGGPGAHGPGGEHLDAPPAHGAAATASPRIETKSELFELVGHLGGGALSTMINRFETNEPVLNATLEVALGTLKATAKFHADHGDYAIDDAAFLKALSAPGEHPLIFTIIAGSDSDLLEGTLTVTPAQAHDDASGHSHVSEYLAIAGGVTALAAIMFALWRRRLRKRRPHAIAEALS